MTLFRTFFISTTSTANLNWKLFATSVPHKLSWLFLYILGCAGRLVNSFTFFRTLTIAHLLNRFVAFLHRLVKCLLLESYGTKFLKVLLTNFFLRRFELSNISVVALLSVLVGTLQDGLLLQGGHCLLLVHAAQPSFRICLTTTEVNSTRNCKVIFILIALLPCSFKLCLSMCCLSN